MLDLVFNLGNNKKEKTLRSLDEVEITMEIGNIKNKTIRFLNTNYY